MYNYLARLGRQKWAQYVVPTLTVVSAGSYIGFQMFGHNIVKNLFIAQSPDGSVKIIDTELKTLIMQVHDDIKGTLHPNRDILNPDIIVPTMFPKAPISWFCTSSMDPIGVGSIRLRNGLTIGLPVNLNYRKHEDVPAEAFLLRKISHSKLFKRSEPKTDAEPTGDTPDEKSFDPLETVNINRESQAAEDYIDSIVLSDKAKKFVIARELYMGDSFKSHLFTAMITISLVFTHILSKTVVQRFKLTTAHISHRMTVYPLAATAGLCNYILLSSSMEQYYMRKADRRAVVFSDEYREGALEYFSKLLKRNKALRELEESFQEVYDEAGELLSNSIVVPLKIEQRLKYVKEPEENKIMDLEDVLKYFKLRT